MKGYKIKLLSELFTWTKIQVPLEIDTDIRQSPFGNPKLPGKMTF